VTDVTEDRARQGRRAYTLAVGFVGVVLTFVAAKWDLPGIGNDASSYIAIADRLAAGGPLGYFLEPKLGLWPPGFPALLALPRWLFDVNPALTALWVNAFALIPTAFAAGWLLDRVVRSERTARIGIAVAVLGPATLSQSYMVQTETTFVLLVLATFIALIRFAEAGPRRWWWFAAAVVAQWAAFMDRYVGLVSIGAGALWLVFERLSGSPLATRFRNGVAFFVGACLVPGAWIIRNTIVTDSQFGPRDTPLATYKGNTVDAVTSVGQFLHGFSRYEPMEGVGRLASMALAAAVGVLSIVLLRRVLASRPAPVAEATSGAPATTAWLLGHPAGLLLIYAAAHWAYMIYSASTIAFDPVNTRYLVSIFIPALVAGLGLADRAIRSAPEGDPLARLVRVGLVVLLVVHLGVGLVRVSASYWTDEAQNYNSPKALKVRESPVLNEVPDDCDRLYSNFPELTYLAGFEAQRSPRKTKFASPDRMRELEDLEEHLAEGGDACLIWVDDDRFSTPQYQYQLDELEERVTLEQLDADDEVAVYRITGLA
jgi:hypothetical protein